MTGKILWRSEHAGSDRDVDQTGAFGFIRLALAAMVIVSHAPELLDGNRLREPLTRLFGTLSFGELAVDGFFIVSGFLVTGSWLRTPSPRDYLRKRLARIYPAFLVAFALSIVVVAPLAGGSLAQLGSVGLALQPIAALAMHLPTVPGAFATLPYPALDGAMWTIALELRCYLIVMLLGHIRVLGRPWPLVSLAAACFALHALLPHRLLDVAAEQPLVKVIVVDPSSFFRLTGHFLTGALWLRLWPRGRARVSAAIVAAVGLAIGLTVRPLAEPAVAVLGGFLVLAASRVPWRWLRNVGERRDISYGLYLYAWPVMNLLILWVPGIGPARLACAALVASAGCGFASWHLVEAPALRAARRPADPGDAVSRGEMAAAQA